MHGRGDPDDGRRPGAATWQDDLEAIAIRRMRRAMTDRTPQDGRP